MSFRGFTDSASSNIRRIKAKRPNLCSTTESSYGTGKKEGKKTKFMFDKRTKKQRDQIDLEWVREEDKTARPIFAGPLISNLI